MTQTNTQTDGVALHTGATVNGVQTQAEVLMQRHTPTTWPTAAQALQKWEVLNQRLNAKDFEVPLHDLAMNPTTGGLFNVRKASANAPSGVIPTRTALGHLMSYGPAPSYNVENLEFYPPEIRADMVRYQLDKAPAKTVTLRTAVKAAITDAHGAVTEERVVRAVTSDIHSKENGDDRALIVQLNKLPQALLDNARMRVIKEWDYTHVEMVVPNKVKEVKPGVVINGRVSLRNSETKGGSFEASVGTLNLVCLNGMVGGRSNSTVTIKHVGDIRTRMRAGVLTVVELIDVYLEEFFEAYQAKLPVTQAEAIERTVKRYALPKDTGAALAALWNVDGERGAGHTVAGLANAMTRHAQSLPVERAIDIEEAAGRVVSDGLSAF
jgi:hypothetical protein